MPPDRFVVSLVCVPELEEAVLDTLLIHFGGEVFTSMPVASHGTDARRLSPMERVLGRRRSVCVQALLSGEEAQELRRLLHKSFAGSGIRYWAVAAEMEGEIA
jgi:hypothetical protein